MCCICFVVLGTMTREGIEDKATTNPSTAARPTKKRTNSEATPSKRAKGKQETESYARPPKRSRPEILFTNEEVEKW